MAVPPTPAIVHCVPEATSKPICLPISEWTIEISAPVSSSVRVVKR